MSNDTSTGHGYTLRIITDGGDLVTSADLGDIDTMAAHDQLSAYEAILNPDETAQLIHDDLVVTEIAYPDSAAGVRARREGPTVAARLIGQAVKRLESGANRSMALEYLSDAVGVMWRAGLDDEHRARYIYEALTAKRGERPYTDTEAASVLAGIRDDMLALKAAQSAPEAPQSVETVGDLLRAADTLGTDASALYDALAGQSQRVAIDGGSVDVEAHDHGVELTITMNGRATHGIAFSRDEAARVAEALAALTGYTMAADASATL